MVKHLLTLLLLSHGFLLSAQGYRVGDVYIAPDGSKGIVYYVFPDGSGGWMVALNDASSGCPWGTDQNVLALTNQAPNQFFQNLLSDTAGYANTQIIRAFQNNSTQYAAGKVDFEHGWVLPSPAQLSMLYGQLPFIQNALVAAGGTALSNNQYWTSAEKNSTEAWGISFHEGFFRSKTKDFSFAVRAVRSFSYTVLVPDTSLTYLWNTGSSSPDMVVSPSQTTTYTVTASTSFGCSTTADQNVIVGTGVEQILYDTICQGAGYEANGFALTTAETDTVGVLTLSRTMITSLCTDTVTLLLTVNPPSATTISQVACDSYIWNGITYYESGAYTQYFTAANGCDSTVLLLLSVSASPVVSVTVGNDTVCAGDNTTLQAWAEDAEIAPSYLWSTGDSTATVAVTPSQTSSYTVTVTTPAGCTDQGHTTVAVVQPQTDILYDVVCQGVPYSANGFALSAEETDTTGMLVLKREVPNTFCTDTVMLMLTVNPKVYTNLTHSACDSYTWNGETYHESGSYSITFANANGCDSVVSLQLTIFQTPDTTHVRMTTCDSYVWHGETLTQPGTYMHTLESAGGCDSVVVLHLRVESVPEVSVHPAIDTICPGDTTVLQAIVDNDSLFAPPPPLPVAIGDILCTDGTTVKLDQFPSSGKTAMGVVFYVDTTDQHGWAMHLQEQDSVQWCCFPHYASQYLADIPELTNFDAGSLALYDLDGYHNTQVIRSFTNTGSIAPADCFLAAYSVDFDNGWYLPAIGQLRVLYGVSLMINPSLLAVGGTPFLQEGTNIHSWDGGYWSSTEQSRYYVLFLQSTGIIKSSGKNSGSAGYRVRAVRNF